MAAIFPIVMVCMYTLVTKICFMYRDILMCIELSITNDSTLIFV